MRGYLHIKFCNSRSAPPRHASQAKHMAKDQEKMPGSFDYLSANDGPHSCSHWPPKRFSQSSKSQDQRKIANREIIKIAAVCCCCLTTVSLQRGNYCGMYDLRGNETVRRSMLFQATLSLLVHAPKDTTLLPKSRHQWGEGPSEFNASGLQIIVRVFLFEFPRFARRDVNEKGGAGGGDRVHGIVKLSTCCRRRCRFPSITLHFHFI